jgi:hypothetical protein
VLRDLGAILGRDLLVLVLGSHVDGTLAVVSDAENGGLSKRTYGVFLFIYCHHPCTGPIYSSLYLHYQIPTPILQVTLPRYLGVGRVTLFNVSPCHLRVFKAWHDGAK